MQRVYELVQSGAEVDATDDNGETALQVMIRRDKFECALALLVMDADVEVKASNGDNALHLAVEVIC